MSFTQERLPLEHAPKEALRIYGNRLLAFTGVIAVNILFFVLVKFAISEPIIFCFSVVFCSAFTFVCWWASRESVLVKAHEIFSKTPENLESDTEAVNTAIIALSTLLGLETEESKAKTISFEAKIKLEKKVTIREFLETSISFQHYLINEFVGNLADKYASRRKKTEWLQLAQTTGNIYKRIYSLMDTMTEEEKYIHIISVDQQKKHEALIIYTFLPSYIDDNEKFKKAIKEKDSMEASKIVLRHIALSPHLWDVLLSTGLTSANLKEIKSIKELLGQQHKELIKLLKYRKISI